MSMLRWLRKLPGLGLSGREARRLVGCDAAGNRYYELKAFGGSSAVVDRGKANRVVMTPTDETEYDPSTIPPAWSAWLRGAREDPPTPAELEAEQQRLATLSIRVQQLEEKEQAARAKRLARGEATREEGHAAARKFGGNRELSSEPTRDGEFRPGAWIPGQSQD